MKIHQIRNATITVTYAGKKFLIDPMLDAKGTKGSAPAGSNSPDKDLKNPLTDLPISVDDIIQDTDAVIVTHLHPDHWDETAAKVLPKNITLFVQNEDDAEQIKNSGFTNVEILQANSDFEGIKLTKTEGQHGSGEVLKMTGLVCGVMFKHAEEKTLYVPGDTIWYEEVNKTIHTHKPEVIVVNAGDNQFDVGGPIIMGKEDVFEVHKAAPEAQIVAVHMEAINHWTLSREELKNYANEKGMSSNLLIPEDGDFYTF